LIVNIAGWVYIIQAALGLWSLTLGPFSFRMSLVDLVALLASALSGFIGYGLLQRDPRARWWALGSSLISWVLGGLVIVVGIAALIFVMFGERGSGGGAFDLAKAVFSGAFLVFFLLALAAAIFMAITVISYKVFWYLCSREGCAEFGVEYGSSGTVLASLGAWIAIAVAEYFITPSGLSGLMLRQAMSRDSRDSQDSVAGLQREAARQQTREALEREEERQRAAMLEEARQALAQSQADERLRGETAPENVESAPPDSEAPVPDFGRADDAVDDEQKTNKILKCRDKSGAVSYTQGYCPPGTTLVDTPKFE
jgi:signal transduction histidine kinase